MNWLCLAAVRRMPRLRSLLQPLLPRSSAVPLGTCSRDPGILPWTIVSPAVISIYGQHERVYMAMRFQRSFASNSTVNSSSQGDHSAGSSTDKNGDFRTLSFRDFMSSVATAPVVPMILGVAGAVPFLALTPPFPYVLPLPEALSANPIEAQALYGAVILSFLGGPHWGLAMVGIHASPNHKIFNYASNSLRYIWSVVPSLLAWPALLMTTVPKLQFLICSFGLALAVDFFFAGHGLTPPWYLPLRLLLSGIVILCLTASLIEVLINQKLESRKGNDDEKSS